MKCVSILHMGSLPRYDFVHNERNSNAFPVNVNWCLTNQISHVYCRPAFSFLDPFRSGISSSFLYFLLFTQVYVYAPVQILLNWQLRHWVDSALLEQLTSISWFSATCGSCCLMTVYCISVICLALYSELVWLGVLETWQYPSGTSFAAGRCLGLHLWCSLNPRKLHLWCLLQIGFLPLNSLRSHCSFQMKYIKGI